MNIHAGEIYGKQIGGKFAMYNVLKTSKSGVILQNIDNPLSQFETTADKIVRSGYIRISQTPFVSLNNTSAKRKKTAVKPNRCPRTVDFLEDRADSERPTAAISDLFSTP